MAKKLSPPPTQPPSSSEEEDSSSEEEQTNDNKPDPQKTLTKKQESECEVLGKEEEEEEDDADDGFEVVALNGDSSGVTENKGKSLKREFPFIRDALGGNRLALEKLESVDVEKAAVLEKKFKKLKLEEINLIRKAYKMVFKEAAKLLN